MSVGRQRERERERERENSGYRKLLVRIFLQILAVNRFRVRVFDGRDMCYEIRRVEACVD